MIKDSGKRQQLPGMVRDVTDDKIDYTLALDGPLLERFARHLTEGAKKYSKRNWMGAHTEAEYLRFRESLVRHFIQYLRGDTDEDHFAAIVFNLNGMEYVKERLDAKAKGPDSIPDQRTANRRGPHDKNKCLLCAASRNEDNSGWDYLSRRRDGMGQRKDD